jgi:release factor glutamine methyltransferase
VDVTRAARLGMTLQQTLTEARRRLVAAGIAPDEAVIDVDVLARTILGWDRARLIVERASVLPQGLEPRFSEWVARRARHEPTAYIVGVKEFWGLDFRVTPAVLIPRPETELIVEEVLALFAPDRRDGQGAAAPRPLRIADIGTGSGCIAVAIARELPQSRLVATDVSAQALAVAMENAVRHGVDDRIEFVETAYLNGVGGGFDATTANPPYMSETDRPARAATLSYEPELALFGGAGGLRVIEGVIEAAAQRLDTGGWLVMELGIGQADDVRTLVSRHPVLRLDRIRHDLQGIPRTAVIRRLDGANGHS